MHERDVGGVGRNNGTTHDNEFLSTSPSLGLGNGKC